MDTSKGRERFLTFLTERVEHGGEHQGQAEASDEHGRAARRTFVSIEPQLVPGAQPPAHDIRQTVPAAHQ